jgi:hypothetical protein
MRIATDRKFTLSDAMVLVAATAVGFWLIRATEMYFSVEPTGKLRYLEVAERGASAMTPFLATWTPAWLVLGLRRPRPRWRVLARRPGAVACVAATLMLGFETASYLATTAVVPDAVWKGLVPFRNQLLPYILPRRVAPAVAGAWLVLALGGRWRPDPSWLDRSGAALGIAWIAYDLVISLIHFLPGVL